MSVRIIDIAYLNRVGKFLSLTMAEGLAKEKVINFHRLNCLNYCKFHNINFDGTKFNLDDLNFIDIPLISSVQAVSDLEAIYFNSDEHGEELDAQAYEEMKVRIDQFKEHFDYENMKQYKDYILY